MPQTQGSGLLDYMSFQKLGAEAKFRDPKTGNYEWGRSPSGERIYVVGYCNCGNKCLLCESEFKEMLYNIHFAITDYSLKEFIVRKYNIRVPKIKIEFGESRELRTVDNWQKQSGNCVV